MKKKIAVIGCGYWGKNLVRNFYELNALHSICESNRKILEENKKKYPDIEITDSFTDILNNPSIEAVVIATPAITHFSLAKQALLHDKDVLVEKPLALKIEEGEELVNISQEKNRILMVDHILQYHPAVIRLKELIDEGTLGKIEYIYSNRLNIGKLRKEENILWSFAPHDISVILELVGDFPDKIDAFGEAYLQKDIYDITVTNLTFRDGLKAHIFVSWLHPFKEQKMIIVGDKNMAVFNDIEEDKLTLFPHKVEWKDEYPVASKAERKPVKVDKKEPLKEACLHFLECIEKKIQPKTDGKEGLEVLRVLYKAENLLKKKSDIRRGQMEKTDSGRKYFSHHSAIIDEPVEIGEGSKIWHFSHIMKGAKIGKNCKIGQNVVIHGSVILGDNVKIQNNVSIYNGVVLEDNVFCGPSMVFTNIINPRSKYPRNTPEHYLKTLVREGATIGANVTVVCGHTIGKFAFIGAGAVVTKDIPDYTLVVGNPARSVGWMCECGNKIVFEGENGTCSQCDLKYIKREGRISRR